MGIMLIYSFTVSTVKKHIDFRAYRLSLESFEKAAGRDPSSPSPPHTATSRHFGSASPRSAGRRGDAGMYRSPHRWGGTGEDITLCSAHRPTQQAIFPSELKASRDKSRLRVSRATRSPPTPIYHHMPPSGSIQWYLPGCRSGRGRAVPPRCHRDCVAPPPGRPGHVAPGPRRARTAGPQVAAWRERLEGRGGGRGGCRAAAAAIT